VPSVGGMGTDTIRAVGVQRFGAEPAALSLPRPVPGPGEVLVRVAAAAVNPADVGMVAGRYRWRDPVRFPLVPGYDVAGTVEEVGAGVIGMAVGLAVVGFTSHHSTQRGGFAELVALPEELVAPAPAGLSAVEAATLPLAGLTALQALAALDPEPGETLLVNGPAGAVGWFAVELAAARGVRVVGPVRAGVAPPPGLAVSLHRDEHLHAQVDGVAAALDVVGGPVAQSTLDAVRDGGRYVTVVPEFWVAGGPFIARRGIVPRVIGVGPDRAGLGELTAAAAAVRITTRVRATFPLSRAADALRAVAAGGGGKVVLVP
jgi:NADPH2:quinone reductase